MEVIISEKIYGDRSGFEKLDRKLRALLEELDVTWKLSIIQKQWVKVALTGEDSEVSANLIKREFGEIPVKLSLIEEGKEYRGRFYDLEKVGYGVYVDIGILTPRPKDALIPIYYLKRTFENIPVKEMIRKYGWVDNIPVTVRIEEVEFGTREITASFEKKQEKIIKKYTADGYDKLFITGTISENIERALVKTNHARDVKRIEELGLMETLLVLKKGTDAPGIIYEIGPLLRGAIIGAVKF